MRLVRFVCLAAALAAVYIAGHIFQHHNLSDFFPDFVLDAVPALRNLVRWLPADLLTLAWWLSVMGAIFFGLVAPSWPLEQHKPWPAASAAHHESRFRLYSGRLLLFLTLLAAIVVILYLAITGDEPLSIRVAWAASIFLWLAGCARLAPTIPPARDRWNGEGAARRPARHGWVFLLLILVGAGLLFGWQQAMLPVLMTEETAQHGLLALAAARGEETHLFINGQPQLSPLAVMLAGLAIRVTGDPLLGLQTIGLLAGLLTVLATWLVGIELFHRPVVVSMDGELILDSGEWVALLAAGLVAANTLMLHFSQLPFYLEPVAWGSLGLWAWLRGLRTGNLLALGLSGVLCGWAAMLYQSGLLFGAIILLWWVGVWLLQPSWLRRPHVSGRLLTVSWFGGLLVTIAPRLGAWLHSPDLWLAYWQGSFLNSLPAMVTIFHLDPDMSARFGYPGDGVVPLLAPLLILAAGALLLNLDRLVGWCLMSWCFCALLCGALLSSHAPFWPMLLPVLPALALILALTLDRVRATLLETAGTWMAQATTYLAISIVIWAGINSWSEHLNFVQGNTSASNYTSQVVHRLDPRQPAALILGQKQDIINLETPILRLASAGRDSPLIAIAAGEWPPNLAPGTILLLQPEDRSLLAELAQRYPGGAATVARDRRANPVLYLYHTQLLPQP